MSRVRTVLGGVGVLVATYGAWLLLSRQDLGQLGSAVVWLAGGVIVHDVVIAGVVLALGLVGSRTLSERVRGPVVAGFVVLATVTLLAVPVLGRFGARSDNPTLLDRDYTAGWFVLAGVVVLTGLVAVAVGVVRRRPR